MSGSGFPEGLCTLLVNHHAISQPSTASWRLAFSSQRLSGPCYSHCRVACMLRSNGSWGTCIPQGITTFLHYASRRSVATQDTAELIGHALQGVEQIFHDGYRFTKAGVILTALVPAHQVQTHLFDRQDRERSQKLMAAIDTINTAWGTGTIRYAAVGLRPAWIMRCTRRSPRYKCLSESFSVLCVPIYNR